VAIHLNRDVNEQGLKFDPQDEMSMILAPLQQQLSPAHWFLRLLANELQVEVSEIRTWDLVVADTQKGAFFGAGNEFIANSRLDNLASCHAAMTALLAADETSGIGMCAFFDHEEVGSESHKGAAGSFLPDVISRIFAAFDIKTDDCHRMLAGSWLVSADMAHAYHPNYARLYDEQHQVFVNMGPAIKISAKQRYASDAIGEAYFADLCDKANVRVQRYVHRNNLLCGSTIGPITAAKLGIKTVDVGCPMWAMHSIRESAGVYDHEAMTRVLTRFFSEH
jgi:aspartyl aminopeptidase